MAVVPESFAVVGQRESYAVVGPESYAVGRRRQLRTQEAHGRLEASLDRWAEKIEAFKAAAQAKLDRETREWLAAVKQYDESKAAGNAAVDNLRSAYEAREAAAIKEHAELLVDRCQRPEWMTVEYSVGFNGDNGILIVDYRLPVRNQMPHVKEAAYVASREDIKELSLSEKELDRLYDDVCYQVSLRTLYELYGGDDVAAFNAIVFNAWVEAVSPSTGRVERACILSVQAERAKFLGIELSRVEPRACFKQLRGIAAATLAGVTPVKPVMELDRTDHRFVAAREVEDALNAGVNLATSGTKRGIVSRGTTNKKATIGSEV